MLHIWLAIIILCSPSSLETVSPRKQSWKEQEMRDQRIRQVLNKPTLQSDHLNHIDKPDSELTWTVGKNASTAHENYFKHGRSKLIKVQLYCHYTVQDITVKWPLLLCAQKMYQQVKCFKGDSMKLDYIYKMQLCIYMHVHMYTHIHSKIFICVIMVQKLEVAVGMRVVQREWYHDKM